MPTRVTSPTETPTTHPMYRRARRALAYSVDSDENEPATGSAQRQKNELPKPPPTSPLEGLAARGRTVKPGSTCPNGTPRTRGGDLPASRPPSPPGLLHFSASQLLGFSASLRSRSRHAPPVRPRSRGARPPQRPTGAAGRSSTPSRVRPAFGKFEQLGDRQDRTGVEERTHLTKLLAVELSTTTRLPVRACGYSSPHRDSTSSGRYRRDLSYAVASHRHRAPGTGHRAPTTCSPTRHCDRTCDPPTRPRWKWSTFSLASYKAAPGTPRGPELGTRQADGMRRRHLRGSVCESHVSVS